MSGSIKLGDKDQFKDDSTPSFLGQLSFAVTNLVVALLDEAALGAIEPVLQAKRRSKAIAGQWEGRWRAMISKGQLVTKLGCGQIVTLVGQRKNR